MPRSAISANGSQEFRKYISKVSKYIDVTLLQNSGKWVFDIDPRYTIALISILRTPKNNNGIILKGPFDSYLNFKNGIEKTYYPIEMEEIASWSEDYAFPLLPHPESINVLRQLKQSPWIIKNNTDEWQINQELSYMQLVKNI